MTALALDMQLDFWSSSEPGPEEPAEAALLREPPVGGEHTLEDLILGAWEGLAAHHAVHCPLCQGEMAPQYGPHAQPVGGRCEDCGTRLS